MPKFVPAFSAAHLAVLRKAGIKPDTIREFGLFDVRDEAAAARFLRRGSGAGMIPAIAFPYYAMDGKRIMTILRPDNPRRDERGKAIKYESPLNSEPRLYFAPPAVVAPARYRGSRLLLLTEGIKKVMAITQSCRFPVISAQGTTVWHDKDYKDRTGEWRLHEDFHQIPLVDRIVVIAFDGGDTSENPPVIEAEAVLARMLLDAHARPFLLRIPYSIGGSKIGIDDYLAWQGDPAVAMNALLESAIHADPVIRAEDVWDADDPPTALQELLQDRSFCAALKLAPPITLDLVATRLKRYGTTKRSVSVAVENFEEWRAASISAEEIRADEITPELKAKAEKLLRREDLLEKFLARVAADGLVGEQMTAKALFFLGVSRLTSKPIHGVVKGMSAGGKNHTVNKVLDLFPKSEVVKITDMTTRSLHYLEEGLGGKIVAITESEGAERAEYALRVVMSEGELVLLVPQKGKNGRLTTERRHVDGRAAFITTTTRMSLHDENETRLLELTLDESESQTRRIVKAQANEEADPRSPEQIAEGEERRRVWRTAMGLLEDHEVRIPQARKLAKKMTTQRLRTRRDFPRLLALIKACTLLHQLQRERDETGRLIATDEDVRIGQEVGKAIFSEVSPRLAATRGKLSDAFGDQEFSTAEAAKILGCVPDYARRLLKDLTEKEIVQQEIPASGSKPATWRLVIEG